MAVAESTVIPVGNPSFEESEGWQLEKGTDVLTSAFKDQANSTSRGKRFARIPEAGSRIFQTVSGQTISKGRYTLSFDAGDVFNDTVSPRAIAASLVRGDTGEVVDSADFAASAIQGKGNIGDPGGRLVAEFFVSPDSAAIGKPLSIRFEGKATSGFAQTAIDHVKMDHDADAPAPARYTLDTSSLEPRTDDTLPGMNGKSPSGTTFQATKNGFYINGKPWLGISGEFHYLRYEEAEWDRELAQIKAAGCDVLATYILWNHHESAPGKWDWSGNLNVRKFVQLAKTHGLFVWIRPGPYCNAETKNGGLPDFALKGKRSNDPGYLAHVERYYKEVAKQLDGLWLKDGGPIIGLQLENEFASGDPKHITKLKKIATAEGMIPAFYSVTANSRFEPGTAIPLQGSYVYRGWENGAGTVAMSGFIYGTDEWSANTDIGGTFYPTLDYPRGFAELGTGSPMNTKVRFLVDPKMVLANAYDCIGRGSNMIGYYMFHGGTQKPGMASADWGMSYDFQAPLGEFGQLRESGRMYRRLHSFLRDFAEEIVPARASRDPKQILDPKQTSRLRYIGRFAKDSGFIFVSNTQRNVEMPTQENVRIAVKTSTGVVNVPSVSLTLPPGNFNAFPFKLDLGGVDLLWATVQPFAKLRNVGELPVTVFWMPEWANGELAFPAGTKVIARAGEITRTKGENGVVLVHAAMGKRAILEVTPPGAGKPTARVVLLTEKDSLDAFPAMVDGKRRLVIPSGADVCSLPPAMKFEGPAGTVVGVEIFPADGVKANSGWKSAGIAGEFARFTATLAPAPSTPEFTPDGKGKWKITGNSSGWAELDHAHVKIDYQGDNARLLSGGQEITRDLQHGEPWIIDVKRFPAQIKAGLTLEVNKDPATMTTTWQPRREIAW